MPPSPPVPTGVDVTAGERSSQGASLPPPPSDETMYDVTRQLGTIIMHPVAQLSTYGAEPVSAIAAPLAAGRVPTAYGVRCVNEAGRPGAACILALIDVLLL